jgi:hypothetical protein
VGRRRRKSHPVGKLRARAGGWGISLAIVCALAETARAEESQLEIGAGYTSRSDHQTDLAGTVGTRGGALSHAHLEATIHPGGRALGVWLRAAGERYRLTERADGASPREMTLGEGAVALAWRGGGALGWGVLAGYGYQTSPLYLLTATSAEARVIHDHGPLVGAALRLRLAPWFAVEGQARAVPLTFGAAVDGQTLTVRRAEGAVGVALGNARVGGVRLEGVVRYELAAATVRGGSTDLTQLRHLVGLAVRISRAERAPLVRAEPPPPPPPAAPQPAPREEPAPPAPVVAEATGGVRGVLWARNRSEPSGRLRRIPLANAAVSWRSDDASKPVVSARSDGRGQFALEGVPAGPGSLHVEAAGLEALDSPLVVTARAAQAVDLTLDPSTAGLRAIIRGNVTTARGGRVRATLAVPETGATVKPNHKGLFQIEVPPGRYTLEVRAHGYVTQRKTVELTGGEESIFAIELRRSRR